MNVVAHLLSFFPLVPKNPEAGALFISMSVSKSFLPRMPKKPTGALFS